MYGVVVVREGMQRFWNIRQMALESSLPYVARSVSFCSACV